MQGGFWLIDGELLTVIFSEDSEFGLSKSGQNYNHRFLWEHVRPDGCGKPFDYYPRGRVEVNSRGKATVFMSLHIDESFIPEIIERFSLAEYPRVHYDGSEHYICHLDTLKSLRRYF